MKNSDWILYYSEKWLEEEINSRGLKNKHELYCTVTIGLKILK